MSHNIAKAISGSELVVLEIKALGDALLTNEMKYVCREELQNIYE